MRKNAANGLFFGTPIIHRCSEQMGTPSGKDGDAQWKRWGRPVEKMGTHSGKDGDAQWKRWGRPVEKMGTPSGKDGDAQWKRWGRPVEFNGDVLWKMFAYFTCK